MDLASGVETFQRRTCLSAPLTGASSYGGFVLAAIGVRVTPPMMTATAGI
jgi:hypothetical protein